MGAQVDIPAEPTAEKSVTVETSREILIRRLKILAPVWTLLAMWLFFSLTSSSFLTQVNFNNILSQVATAGILAVGMTFVLLTGEIDLSIAAVMGLAGYVATQFYNNGLVISGVLLGNPYSFLIFNPKSEPIPIIAGLVVATLCGAGSGLISQLLRVPTFMATLALSLIAEGLLLWISQGRQYFTESISPLAIWIGSTRIGGLRYGTLIVLTAVCMLIGYLVLRYTRFGRYVYMTGANSSAARLAGINTKLIIFAVLTISGFTAGVAGIAAMGRLGTTLPSVQSGYLIDAIAVVVLGGTALTGGRGGILQTAIGLLIYGSLSSGLNNIANIDTNEKTFITGLVLLAALVVNIVFAGKADRDRT